MEVTEFCDSSIARSRGELSAFVVAVDLDAILHIVELHPSSQNVIMV